MGTFKPSFIGFGEFLRGEELQAEMLKRAEKIAEAARAIAPEGAAPRDKHPGHYKASFEVTSGVTADAKGDLRAFGRVSNSAPYAADVEYGRGGRSKSPHKDAHHVLGRAMDSARD